MSCSSKRTSVRAGAALVALAVTLFTLTSVANAQTAPFTAYGSGLTAGATVEARVGSTACGSTIVDADGNWVLYVAATDPCAPKEGSTITFRLDGQTTSQTATFTAGGAPDDIANGITLTVPVGGSFSGSGVFNVGVNIAVFSGGTLESMAAAAPNAISFAVTVDGALKIYIPGAPAFVNVNFTAAFPSGTIPAGTPVIIIV